MADELLLLSPIQSQKFTILLEVEGRSRKLFTVHFRRVGGELEYMVHLPYFSSSQGVLARFTLDGPAGSSKDLKLSEIGAKTVSHAAKYSHHRDGTAIFNQDDRIIAEIRSKTRPLRGYLGHLFTIHFWGADGFRLANDSDLRFKSAKAPMKFHLSDVAIAAETAGRMFALARPHTHYRSRISATREQWSRPLVLRDGDGQLSTALVIAPYDARPDDFAMSLTYVPMERGTSMSPSMVALGGFVDSGDSSNPSASVDSIAAIYTDRDDWEDTVRRLGSLDYVAEIALGELDVTRDDT